jgi:Fic family protein
MGYEDRYKMTKDENIFLAKRDIVDYIYKSARLEGLNVTYPDTYAIYEQAKLKNADIHAINVILNLKHAWQMLLRNIDSRLDLNFLKDVHKEVARGEAIEWGVLRTGAIGIGGTGYIPPIPDEKTAQDELGLLLQIKIPTERAIEVMLWGMKKQLFWDGNKRTSMLAANKIMIQNGCGIISILPEYFSKFHTLLSDYYTNGTIKTLKHFIYEKCISGINFR